MSFRCVSLINLLAEWNDYLLLAENACRCGTIFSKLLTCQIIFYVDTREMQLPYQIQCWNFYEFICAGQTCRRDTFVKVSRGCGFWEVVYEISLSKLGFGLTRKVENRCCIANLYSHMQIHSVLKVECTVCVFQVYI